MHLPRTIRNVPQPGALLHRALNQPHLRPTGTRAALVLSRLLVGIVALAAWTTPLRAATVTIPNGSFENPATTFAYPQIDAWQQVPVWYAQETGVFLNQPPSDPTHIDNCDGAQGAFLFASNQVAILQDYDSIDWSNSAPTHAFGATFNVGKSYLLTVGVIGGTNLSIPMQEGTRLGLSLYYRDSASNMVTVASTSITNSEALFPSATHFIDFQVPVSTVKASDPWAGQHIGVQMLSSVTPDLEGGYWDLDNVRLASYVPTVLLDSARTNGQFACTLQSEPGLRFEMLASTNLNLPLSNWTSLGTVTNLTGVTPFADPATNLARRFFRARQLP